MIDISFEDIETAIGAMESWVDAFQDEFPEDAAIVARVILAFNQIIELHRMKEPKERLLRLVKKDDDIH